MDRLYKAKVSCRRRLLLDLPVISLVVIYHEVTERRYVEEEQSAFVEELATFNRSVNKIMNGMKLKL